MHISFILSTITFIQLWGYVKDVAGMVAVISVFVEITPIHINPLSLLFNKLGNAFTKDLKKDIKDLKTDIDTLKENLDDTKKELNNKIDNNKDTEDERYVMQLRGEILNFSNSCIKKELHTKDEFDHIIDTHARYEKLIEEKNLTNGRVDIEFNYIQNIYTELLKENAFL